VNETELDALLRDVSICKLVCLDREGYPIVVPLVYEYCDGGFYIMSHRPTVWAEQVLAHGQVALLIEEGLRRLLVHGKAEPEEEAVVLGRLFGDWKTARAPWKALAQQIRREPVASHWFFVRPTRILQWQGSDWAPALTAEQGR
jgi:hypothetical protein